MTKTMLHSQKYRRQAYQKKLEQFLMTQSACNQHLVNISSALPTVTDDNIKDLSICVETLGAVLSKSSRCLFLDQTEHRPVSTHTRTDTCATVPTDRELSRELKLRSRENKHVRIGRKVIVRTPHYLTDGAAVRRLNLHFVEEYTLNASAPSGTVDSLQQTQCTSKHGVILPTVASFLLKRKNREGNGLR